MNAVEEEFRSMEILLVEDNPVDVLMVRNALDEGMLRNTLHVVEDGEAAMDFLRERCTSSDDKKNCPNLILLDLNLPKKSGKEVLAEIKRDPDLRRIPVVILTTSSDDKDVCDTYSLHANCFVTKPVQFEQFGEVVRSIERFWFTTAKLPDT